MRDNTVIKVFGFIAYTLVVFMVYLTAYTSGYNKGYDAGICEGKTSTDQITCWNELAKKY